MFQSVWVIKVILFLYSVNDYLWFWIPIVGPHIGAILGVVIYVLFIEAHWPETDTLSINNRKDANQESNDRIINVECNYFFKYKLFSWIIKLIDFFKQVFNFSPKSRLNFKSPAINDGCHFFFFLPNSMALHFQVVSELRVCIDRH